MIKAAQYVSHRRDLVGQELADKFFALREGAPMHSWDETCTEINEESNGKMQVCHALGNGSRSNSTTNTTAANGNSKT